MNFERQRLRLVDHELRRLGVRDERVLHAMARVPREEFVPFSLRHAAYENIPLPIECGQTISQPLVVAHMAEALALEPSDRALEIGSGSGYAAAVLALLAKEVFTVEVHPELAHSAAQRLQRLGYANVQVRCADGAFGWPEVAPFDAIVAAAASPTIPPALLTQLKVGGRLVIPIGLENQSQELLRVVRRSQDDYASEKLGAVRFVPFVSPPAT